VHSGWVREHAVGSGIPRDRVRVIPLGIDPQMFTPVGKRYELATRARVKFLFVGATVQRKGFDILLNAYGQAFGANDEVCLVVKDHTRDVFYRGISSRARIDEFKRTRGAPELIYIDEYLPDEELASLYRACDFAVFPYRAEGFALPVLEALACGVPPIVPRFGACLDYCTARNALLMPVHRIRLPVAGRFVYNTLGFEQALDGVDFCEVPVDTLAEYLRRAHDMAERQREALGRAGVDKARSHFTWKHSAAAMGRALLKLSPHGVPRRLRGERRDNARQARHAAVARALYAKLLDPL
jgi:glycosyltransferase involved in cell wall biosynthesis